MNNSTIGIAILIVFVLYAFGIVGKSNGGLQSAKSLFKGLIAILKGTYSILKWLFTGSQKAKEIYGTAKFLQGNEKDAVISPTHNGLVIEGDNRLTESLSFQQVAIIATTGSGKTTKYVIPQLLTLKKADRSFVLTDPTSEIYNQTSGYLSSLGFAIERIDFSSASKSSFRYNPLAKIRNHSDCEKVADILIRSAFPDRNGNNSFWNDFATNIISTHIKCLKSPNVPTQFQNLANLRFLLNKFGTNGSALLDFYVATADAVTHNEIMGIINNDERVLLSGVSTAKTALKLFSDPDICLTTSGTPEHQFTCLREKPTVFFVGLLEDEQERYRPLLSLYYSELFGHCMKMEDGTNPYLPIYVLLEEAGNLVIPSLSGYVTTLRKRKVSLSLIIQSEQQLYKNYGREDAQTIISNCNTKVYFPGLQDLETLQKLERLLGNQTIEYMPPERSLFGGGDSKRQPQLVSKPLLFANDIRTMDHALMIASNIEPIILDKMKPFYEDSVQNKRSKLSPYLIPTTSTDPIEFLDLHFFSNKPKK